MLRLINVFTDLSNLVSSHSRPVCSSNCYRTAHEKNSVIYYRMVVCYLSFPKYCIENESDVHIFLTPLIIRYSFTLGMNHYAFRNEISLSLIADISIIGSKSGSRCC